MQFQVKVTPRAQRDRDGQFRSLPEIYVTVELELDLQMVANFLGARAYRNSSGEAMGLSGRIKAKVIK